MSLLLLKGQLLYHLNVLLGMMHFGLDFQSDEEENIDYILECMAEDLDDHCLKDLRRETKNEPLLD